MATGTISVSTNHSGSEFVMFPDGTLICWGGGSYNPVSSTGSASGSIYFHEFQPDITFPVEFTSTPRVVVSRMGGREGSISWVAWTTKKITGFDMLGGLQTNANSAQIAWIAIGRWK